MAFFNTSPTTSATGHLCDDMIILCHFPGMLRQGLERCFVLKNWRSWANTSTVGLAGMHGEKWGWFREGSCSHCGKIREVNQEIMCFQGLLLVGQGGAHLLVSPMQPV